jgi:hypothetical protein
MLTVTDLLLYAVAFLVVCLAIACLALRSALRGAASERRELYNRLQAGSFGQYAYLKQQEDEKPKPKPIERPVTVAAETPRMPIAPEIDYSDAQAALSKLTQSE